MKLLLSVNTRPYVIVYLPPVDRAPSCQNSRNFLSLPGQRTVLLGDTDFSEGRGCGGYIEKGHPENELRFEPEPRKGLRVKFSCNIIIISRDNM